MVKLTTRAENQDLSHITDVLSKKMISPLCGLVKEIGFLRRASRSPRIISTGADLTGVHVLLNKPHPGRGGYHIGAAGMSLDEALIKTLGESVERYAQLIAEVADRFSRQFCSYPELVMLENDSVIHETILKPFFDHQFNQSNFPFVHYTDQPLDWIKLPSLLGGPSKWIPTQLVWVGYQIKHAQGEPWLSPAVTTGTAAHTDKITALKNAVLEIIQIDSAMGHWYSSRSAKKIQFDVRTRLLEKILMRQGHFNPLQFSFYWLENPDLSGFSIACVYRNEHSVPRIAIGLGADGELIRAMYKAFLEAVGVLGLSRLVLAQNKIDYASESCFYDLDSNVGYYASGYHYSFINEKFSSSSLIDAAKLPPDLTGTEIQQLSILLDSFKKSNKELFFCDLTCLEAGDLGFVVPRVWSPDTLSLCLPSAPWLKHPRYLSYGGVAHEFPHPYP